MFQVYFYDGVRPAGSVWTHDPNNAFAIYNAMLAHGWVSFILEHSATGSPRPADGHADAYRAWLNDEELPPVTIEGGLEPPANFEDPDWDEDTFERCHEWRRHVGDSTIRLWPSLSIGQRAAIACDAQERASLEEWD